MRRKQSKKTGGEVILFDVVYEDGSRTSNRRIPAAEMEGLDGEARVREFIRAQDREIAQKSRRPRPEIKSVTRTRAK